MSNETIREAPNYYAILPANVRYCKSISAQEKLLYAEITALANAKGYCFASNNYFADLYGMHKNSISRSINNLEKSGFIKIVLIYHEDTKAVKERRIYINIDTPINKNVDTPINKNVDTPINKNVKDNTTSINTTSINNNKEKPKKDVVVKKENEHKKSSLVQIENKEELKKVQFIINENFSIDINLNQAKSIFKASNNDFQYLQNKIDVVKQSNYDDLISFLISALKNDFIKASIKKKTKFNNYKGRDWNYEELEKLEFENLIKN